MFREANDSGLDCVGEYDGIEQIDYPLAYHRRGITQQKALLLIP
jgi:hypothetical protein